MQGPARLVPLERERETAELRSGQEPLPALAPVSPDAGAGVGALWSIAVDLGLAQDDREDGRGAVRRAGRGVKGCEPALHVSSGDVCNIPSPEPRQNLVPEVAPIDLQRSRLPVSAVVPEDFLGDGLEDRLLRQGTPIPVAPNRSKKARLGQRLQPVTFVLEEVDGTAAHDRIVTVRAHGPGRATRSSRPGMGMTRADEPMIRGVVVFIARAV